MEQNPSWESNSHSANQEISTLQWNLKIRYCIHYSPPLVPVLSYMNPVHTLPTYFSKIHTNIIFLSTFMSSNWSSLQVSQPKIYIHFSSPPWILHIPPISSHPSWFDHPQNIWWGLQVMKLLIMQSSSVLCHFFFLRSKYSQHPVLRCPQSIFFPYWSERLGFTPIQYNRFNYSFAYCNHTQSNIREKLQKSLL